MPGTLNVTGATGTLDVGGIDLQEILKMSASSSIDQSSKDLITDQRGHTRFGQVMDRVFLSTFTEDSASLEKTVGGLNTVSHIPFAQPWAPPTLPQ